VPARARAAAAEARGLERVEEIRREDEETDMSMASSVASSLPSADDGADTAAIERALQKKKKEYDDVSCSFLLCLLMFSCS
jgi:hypothetical protein